MAAPGRCVLWWCGTAEETAVHQPCLILRYWPRRASQPGRAAASQRRTELWDRRTRSHTRVIETDKQDTNKQKQSQRKREQRDLDGSLDRLKKRKSGTMKIHNSMWSVKKKVVTMTAETFQTCTSRLSHYLLAAEGDFATIIAFL